MKMNILATIFFTLLVTVFSAQTAKLNIADDYYKKLSYALAIPLYEELLGTDKWSPSIQEKLALCYYNTGNMEKSEYYFSQMINTETASIEDYFLYSQVLKQIGKNTESDQWLSKLSEKNSNDLRGLSFTKNKDYRSRIDSDSYHFEVRSLSINTPFTEFGGYSNQGTGPMYIITNRKQRNAIKTEWTWNTQSFLDFFTVEQMQGGSLGTPKIMKGSVNTKFHEGPLCFSGDGKTIYFTRNNIIPGKQRKDHQGIQNLKLYKSQVDESGKWLKEEELSLNSSEYSVGHPSLSVDGKRLYFASDMPGGYGGADLYYVELQSDGTLSKPVNLGSSINTEGNEMFPWLSSLGDLYFSSNGHVGLGGLDLFVCFPVKTGGFKKVTNLGNKINSPKDDFAMLFTDDKMGYFSSNRMSGQGDDDIYGFTMLVPYKRGISVEGVIADKNTESVLPESIVVLKDNNGNVVSELTADKDGKYTYELEEDKQYTVYVKKGEYFEEDRKLDPTTADAVTGIVNGDVSLEKQPAVMLICGIKDGSSNQALEGVKVSVLDKSTKTSIVSALSNPKGELRSGVEGKKAKDPVTFTVTLEKEGYLKKTVEFKSTVPITGVINLNEVLDMTMDKIAIGTDLATIIDINPIYFDLGKADIRKDASKELDKIVKVMNENPTMVVELGSHTDCRSSYKFNMDLSSRRAIASANFIKKRITNPDRIYGKGFGESKLKVDCPCEGTVKSSCSEEEHQKNRRTEFVIKKM